MITVEAKHQFDGVHKGPVKKPDGSAEYRQPLIIPRELESKWLDPDLGFANAVDLMRSHYVPSIMAKGDQLGLF
jgi:hypothetical protein